MEPTHEERIEALEREVAALKHDIERHLSISSELLAERDKHMQRIAKLEQDAGMYCPTCGSCGEAGCCSPSDCRAVVCMYGEQNIKDYRELDNELEQERAQHAESERRLNKAWNQLEIAVKALEHLDFSEAMTTTAADALREIRALDTPNDTD